MLSNLLKVPYALYLRMDDYLSDTLLGEIFDVHGNRRLEFFCHFLVEVVIAIVYIIIWLSALAFYGQSVTPIFIAIFSIHGIMWFVQKNPGDPGLIFAILDIIVLILFIVNLAFFLIWHLVFSLTVWTKPIIITCLLSLLRPPEFKI